MITSPEELPPVSRTAVGVAALRALESQRPDRLFEDSYAGAFSVAGRAVLGDGDRLEGGLGEVFAEQVAVRTRFFDEYVRGSRQVVLLAAGLDARAFRLEWPDGARVFELDLPDVLRFKDEVLAELGAEPKCERIEVPADLTQDWVTKLREAGFDASRPTTWLAEGLLVYLGREAAEGLLARVTELSVPGSRVSFEHRPEGERDGLLQRARRVGGPVTELWRGGLGAEAPQWLAERGWQSEMVTVRDLAAGYGREVRDETTGGFLVATKR
ncbi:SAM-dependent methyltransferase [Amycolatopsis rhabdoformis]|uniref:S-adenosyl-L-methionine-dependent methyltransferase n=1 Tax=Amycolatopsis rhabdoformis TaxID=1448059 RepID=A0ABZ1I0K7_9PSEU|nr:SAM-dependent methyltransferase [Amycolatopsis rhabdoformis]WSE27937.1 SAM-dependent methyltransferase [Amycolatopsis rhabdoformis]